MKIEFFCDDWTIIAFRDGEFIGYQICENAPEWDELHPGADREDRAVERYMLPLVVRAFPDPAWLRWWRSDKVERSSFIEKPSTVLLLP